MAAATVQDWARNFIESRCLATKCAPPAAPTTWKACAAAERILRPGRPPELRTRERSAKAPKSAGLGEPRSRARLLHTFWHHELQAAELMCWAILAFPETEQEFKQGLLGIFADEIRHMRMYAAHIERLGFAVGEFDVRDWFWERVPSCKNAVSFVALMGMGLEAANLDHAPAFADRFRDMQDEPGAQLQERIAAEEVPHVHFATHWFERWTGGCDFQAWRSFLPPPLSPLLMRGPALNRQARAKATMPKSFMDKLEGYDPETDPEHQPPRRDSESNRDRRLTGAEADQERQSFKRNTEADDAQRTAVHESQAEASGATGTPGDGR